MDNMGRNFEKIYKSLKFSKIHEFGRDFRNRMARNKGEGNVLKPFCRRSTYHACLSGAVKHAAQTKNAVRASAVEN